MKLTVVAVDKLRNKHMRALAKDYTGRINRGGKLKTIEVKASNAATAHEQSEEESEQLLGRAKHSSVIIALDEKGTSYTSMKLAKQMDEDMLRGRSHWTLLLGGANGHSSALRKRATRVWSLSELTLPHELARVVVLEQLYRALSIVNGSPYHREG